MTNKRVKTIQRDPKADLIAGRQAMLEAAEKASKALQRFSEALKKIRLKR